MNIGIVGLGLIGGSIAKSLNKKHKISAFDSSIKTIEYAINNKIIHKSFNNLSEFFAYNEVIYLCLYPKDIVNFIFRNKDLLPKNSVFIEVSGIKKYLINKLNNYNIKNIDIIFSHPIAGSEKIGVYNSDANIFANANYVITPTDKNKNKNINLAKKLAKDMGFLNISIITPEEHDNIISYTSQLTHVLSLSLVNSISTKLDTKRFIGDSYRDLTRISMINEKLWPELFINNKAQLLEKIDKFRKELDLFRKAIEDNNSQKLMKLMVKSTNIRRKIENGVNDES